MSSDYWKYVPGYLNPADIPTRDINIQSFANNAVWWNGPNFLTMDELDWPVQHTFQDFNYFREVRFGVETQRNNYKCGYK